MKRPMRKKFIAFSLATLFGSSAAFGSVSISDINIASNLYSGLQNNIRFNISSTEIIENGVVTVGLTGIDPELSKEENRVLNVPEMHLASIPVYVDESGSTSIDRDFVVPPISSADGEYALIVSLDTTADITNGKNAEVIEDSNSESIAFEYADTNVQYQTPNLPSLEITTLEIEGSNGYTLSKSNASNLRINLELTSRSKDIIQPINTNFSLVVPGAGEFKLPVAIDGKVVGESWVIAPECKDCPSLMRDSLEGAGISLLLNEEVQSAINKRPTGSLVELNVVADSNYDIEEWNNKKDDNSQSISIFITE